MFKKLAIASFILLVIYILAVKSELYVGLFKKITELASMGIKTITTGKAE